MAGLEKVGTGQRFKPRADTWNALIDAARYVQDRALSQGSSAERLGEDAIAVRNASDFDVPRYGLLWLTGSAFEGLVLATRPGYPFLANLSIAAEPIAAGAVGRAWNDGQHPLRIAGWEDLVAEDFPLLAISQAGVFEAAAWTGTGMIPVLAKLDDSPLVLADLSHRGL